jgi:hypothetical protein
MHVGSIVALTMDFRAVAANTAGAPLAGYRWQETVPTPCQVRTEPAPLLNNLRQTASRKAMRAPQKINENGH